MRTVFHRLFTALLAAGLMAACTRTTARQERPSAPFTPEVDEFVTTYLKYGGNKLTDWVQGDTPSPPEEALRAFQTMDGLAMDLVAAEPVIRQPIDLHFDDRGRLWVVQYLQYPFPAGLTVTGYDQYLRAQYDGVPAPPPNHVRGADKITVLEDTDGDGTFDAHKDVITGLNITTSVLTGRGGVWVMNPPYLLFYPDATGDGLPDRDPEVRLSGFGLEDTHSLANSLTWGPDGWLYGVHGSTSTGKVMGISFLGQAVWRYHPDTRAFELFAEGGGNPWTLTFDRKGRAFSGDNGGNSRGFHWVRGGRYLKNWPKHGPFTRPHSYGYFPHMDHEGYAARFAMTSVVYDDGKLPGYEGQLIAGMALTSRVQASRLVPDGSTFRTVDTDAVVTTSERSFRPVDTVVGPDGAVYFADWCDIRMDHTDPRDTWDKSCGRIWRLRASQYEPVRPFDLARQSSADLVQLLGDSRKWWREQARTTLVARRDESVIPHLAQAAREQRGQLALEALWTWTSIAGMDARSAIDLRDHPDAAVRAWTVRLIDRSHLTAPLHERLVALARGESDPEVRSELAGLSGRLGADRGLPVLTALIGRDEDAADKHIPLRIWWAIEQHISEDPEPVLDWLDGSPVWNEPLFTAHLASRIARRFAAARGDKQSFTRLEPPQDWKEYAQHPRARMPGGKGDYTDWTTNYTPAISDANLTRLARVLEMSRSPGHRDALLTGMKAGLEQGPALERVPAPLSAIISKWWAKGPRTAALVDVAARLGQRDAIEAAAAAVTSASDAPRRAGPASAAGRGREGFLTHCAPCHQADGSGMARLAPPLRQSPLVLGSGEALARIVLHGLRGEMLMPPMGTLDDEQLAAILTYVRGAWGHEAPPVSPATIVAVREASRARSAPWTRAELTAIRGRD